MINWRVIKKDKIYKIVWKDPITYLDEPLGREYAQRVNIGKVVITGKDLSVISAWFVDPSDGDMDYTKIPKNLVLSINVIKGGEYEKKKAHI